MPVVVHMGGAKGVGKTSVSGVVKSLVYPEEKIGVLNASACIKETIGSHLDWRLMVESERKRIRDLTWSIKMLRYDHDIVLIDSHYVDETDGIYKIILSPDKWAHINTHIILETSAEQILSRRVKDKTRERDLDIKNIQKEIEAERDAAYMICKETGGHLLIMSNDFLNDSANNILGVLRSFKKIGMK